MNNVQFIMAQSFGFLAMFIGIVSFQFKNMNHILISQLLCNGLSVLNYALMDGMSGAGICIIAIVQSIVIFIFNKKEKRLPLSISAIFILLYVICSCLMYRQWRDLLSGLAALMFAFGMLQNSSARYRIFMIANVLLWIGFDVSIGSWVTVIMRSVMLASIIRAVIFIDNRKEQKTTNDC